MVAKKISWVLLVPLLMGAEIYRWVDENGVVNYTQQSPDGVPAERIVTRSGAPSVAVSMVPEAPVADAPDQALSPQQRAELEKLQTIEKARQEEIARIKQSNCDRATSVLERLSSKGRIRVRDNDGQESAMPEEERQSRIADAQRDIVNNCPTTATAG